MTKTTDILGRKRAPNQNRGLLGGDPKPGTTGGTVSLRCETKARAWFAALPPERRAQIVEGAFVAELEAMSQP